MNPHPIEIRRKENAIELRWSDGKANTLAASLLRKECPCATCREARGDEFHQSPLGSVEAKDKKKTSMLKVVDHSADEQLRIEEIRAVGNYAISITWGDKHNTGIYSFEQLRSLCNN